jgi:hypothetical protein
MRRAAAGVALIGLLACGCAFAGDVQPSSGFENSPKVQTPQSSGRKQRLKKSAQATRPSLPLSSAETYTAEHRGNLPVAPAAKPPVLQPAAPAGNPWTGFYVGTGAGAGRE